MAMQKLNCHVLDVMRYTYNIYNAMHALCLKIIPIAVPSDVVTVSETFLARFPSNICTHTLNGPPVSGVL